MTLTDLRKAILNEITIRINRLKQKANEPHRIGYVNGLPESTYERRLRLTPEQRYQDIKRQSYEHKDVRYYKYHAIYREFYKAPDDGDFFKAYNISSSKAEAKFNELYKTLDEQGCSTDRYMLSCLNYRRKQTRVIP
jgi:hypothetical protein